MSNVVEFGAMAPPLKKQLRGVIITGADQNNVDAITRLHVHRLLSDTEARRARFRLLKQIERRKP